MATSVTASSSPGSIVRAFQERMEARDWNAAGDLLAPDLELRFSATGEVFRGSNFLAMNIAYPEGWTIYVDEVIEAGNRVACQLPSRWTVRPSGVQASTPSRPVGSSMGSSTGSQAAPTNRPSGVPRSRVPTECLLTGRLASTAAERRPDYLNLNDAVCMDPSLRFSRISRHRLAYVLGVFH